MNYGLEIYVDRNRIRLTEDLLRPLSASSGTTLYGIHNPYDGKDELLDIDKYSHSKAIHDFVITTVPFELWPSCIAGRLDIKHEKGVLQKVLTAFKRYGLNILHLRCTRSGHHYTTVSFIAFLINRSKRLEKDDIDRIILEEVLERRDILTESKPGAKSTPEQLKSYAQNLTKEASQIKRDLLNCLGSEKDIEYKQYINEEAGKPESGAGLSADLKDVLYWDSAFDRTPVGIWALKNLAYFYSKSVNEKTQSKVTQFEAVVSADWSIAFKDPEKLAILTGMDRDLPSVGFASLDTETHIIRLAILSPIRLESFRSVNLSFRFVASENRTFPLGALHDLVSAVSKDWNVWRIYNRGGRYGPAAHGKHNFLTGQVNLIMEYETEFGSSMVPLDDEIRNMLQNSVGFDEFQVKPPIEVKKLSSRKIFISIKGNNQLERASEILEICKEIGSEFGFLPDNVRTVIDYGVNSITQRVSEIIHDSSGLIQFLMSDDSGSSFTWIESEFLLATDLGLPTVRIVDPRLEGKNHFIRDKADISLPEFASSNRFRMAIRTAFQHIVNQISDTGVPLGG
jgi:hypothetical protein